MARWFRTFAHVAFDLIAGAVLVAVAVVVVGARTSPAPTAGAPDAPPAELTAAAADVLEAVTAPGGTGVTFEIVQHSVIHAREGETLADKSTSHELGTYLESGFLVPDGFYAEMRRGPDDPDTKPDFSAGTIELRTLVRDGVTWRDDGAGWYLTDQPPGIGLDPATAALLPTLLREATDPRDVETAPVEGDEAVRTLEATAKVADIPGVIAVDLADATELTEPVALRFDDTGRLVGLTVLARNTRLTDADLLVDTVISLAYPASAPSLPEPEPRWVEPSPDPGGGLTR
jgi:hypothetical protein